MALLHDIQTALLDDKSDVSSILLKLKFLASKLDDGILEEWVSHESEGYPDEAIVPDYRTAQVTYTCTVADAYRQINNVSIPRHLIEKHAGDNWIEFSIRDGLPIIESRLKSIGEDGHFGIDASNLKLLLQGKVYPSMSIIEIDSRIDNAAFVRIQHAVRSRTLDFALELEKRVEVAAQISVGEPSNVVTKSEQEDVRSLTQQIFYGDVTNIHALGGSQVNVSVTKGDIGSLVGALEAGGISKSDAKELAAIVEQEEQTLEQTHQKAEAWLMRKLKEGASEVWGIGRAVARELIKESIKQYCGLD